jgi:branched-chain amino acid transport system substrate-binding protein
MRSFDRRTWALVAALTLVVAACGTRMDHKDVVAAAGGSGTSASPTAQGSSRRATSGAPGVAAGDDAPAVDSPGEPSGEVQGAEAGTGGTSAAGGPGGATAADGANGASASPTKSPIVIGSVGNYSGPGGATIAAGAEALKVWARWTNDHGGLAGHRVDVISVDDGQDPARYQAAIKDLVENRHVLAFVAQMAPYTIQAGVQYLERKHIPVIGGDCAEHVWNESPMMFNQCADLQTTLYATTYLAAQFGKGKKWGLLYCVEAQACPDSKAEYIDNGVAEESGMDPVYSAQVSIAQPDFTAECIEARNRGVEVLTVIADTNTLGRVANSCARQGYHPEYAQSGGTMDAKTAANPNLEGTVVSVNTFPHVPIADPGVQQFTAAMAKYAPGSGLQAFHSLGWAAAKLFEKAAAKVGEPATTQQILDGLWSMHGETLGGLTSPMTFVRDKGTPKSSCFFSIAIKGGKQVAPSGLKQFCRAR